MSSAALRLASADKNIVLIGYRGSGKTTVGRCLAERVGRRYIDTDEAVERGTGRTIREIFERDGEARFRMLEHEAVREALAGTDAVVSVGGGAVDVDANMKLLDERGVCLWLRATPGELWRRVQADPRTVVRRPALTEQNGLAEIEQVLASRTPQYQRAARAEFDTDGRSIAEVVDEILLAIGRPAIGGA